MRVPRKNDCTKGQGWLRCPGLSGLERACYARQPSEIFEIHFKNCGWPLRRQWRDAFDLERHVRYGLAACGEDSTAHRGVRIPGHQPATFRQTRAGAIESLRPGGAVDAVEHRTERDHRGR